MAVMDRAKLKTQIQALLEHPDEIDAAGSNAVDEVLAALDVGQLRVCEPSGTDWITHAWIKHAILLYFARTSGGRNAGRERPHVLR